MHFFAYVWDFFYYFFTRFCMWLYIQCESRHVAPHALRQLIGLSGKEDTNAGTMLWLRIAYTYAPAPFQLDPRERFFGEPLICKRFHKLIRRIRCFGLVALPVPQRSLYAAYFARAYESRRFLDAHIARGYKQIVILGAGMDSTAYRYYRHEALHFVEVDLPHVVERKRAAFRQIIAAAIECVVQGERCEHFLLSELKLLLLELHEPENLTKRRITYLGCDFEKDDLAATLRRGINPQLKTLVLWEGVTYYLTPRTVVNMFKTLREVFADFHLFFDYMREEPKDSWFWRAARKVSQLHGTDFINIMPDCETQLEAAGYRIQRVHTREQTLKKLQPYKYYWPLFMRGPRSIQCIIDLTVVEACSA